MERQAQQGGVGSQAAWPELEVRAVVQSTATVKVFDLAAPGGEPLADIVPGAHIKVSVRDRMGMPDVRAYSLIERGAGGGWRIAVKFDPDGMGGSRYMHETVREGDRLRCSPPANDFPLKLDATHSLLIAGGIGITPILAMATALAARKRSFALHYVGRRRDDMALADRVAAVAGARASFYEDGGEPSRGIPLETVLANPQAGTELYVCGPEGLIEDTLATARRLGWDGENLHAERFAAPPPRTGDHPVEVVLARSGRSLSVPADRSILDVLIDAGIDPLYDCRKGTCGLCAQTVVEAEGGVDHRDHFFGHGRAGAGERMCVCVSRINGGRLVLDL